MTWLRKSAVAREAGCAEKTVTKYARRGLIPFRLDSRGWREYPPKTPRLIREILDRQGGPAGRPLKRD